MEGVKSEPIKTLQVNEAGTRDPVLELGAHVVTSIGSQILGGWHGLATLASGGTLKDAAEAVTAAQERGTYQPQGEMAQKGAEALASPYNPMNWVSLLGKKAGEVSQDLGASPAVATGIETAVNAAPLLLLMKGKEAAKSGASDEKVPLKLVKPETAASPEPNLDLTPAEQMARANTLKRIGMNEARESAITGNPKSAATDFQTSKVDNPAGNYVRSVLDNERQALVNHAEGIVEGTGGTVGTDSAALYSRGNTIIAPLDKLKQWFDNKTSELYKAADEKAQGVPMQTPKLHEFVSGDQAEFLGTTEGESLLKGIKARMKSLGMADAEGKPLPTDVASAERFKQYLNNVWQPRTAKLIRGLKDSIDEDVTSTAGEDIYKQARAIRAMRATTLDDPNGISKLMDASGPEGVNRAVPIEKVPDALIGMPKDQLAHVVKTLQNVPKELQPDAQAALSEIKAHMANKVLEAGNKTATQWNARGVDKFLNNNASKMDTLFSKEEIAKLEDLRQAGKILSKETAYPGAAVQEHNLVRRGVMGAIRAGSTAVGGGIGSIAGPAGAAVGAAAGEYAGGGLAAKFGERAALRAAQKRVVNLRDVRP